MHLCNYIHNQLMRHIIKKGLWINKNWLYFHCGACMHLVHAWEWKFTEIIVLFLKLIYNYQSPTHSSDVYNCGRILVLCGWWGTRNREMQACVVLYRKRKCMRFLRYHDFTNFPVAVNMDHVTYIHSTANTSSSHACSDPMHLWWSMAHHTRITEGGL